MNDILTAQCTVITFFSILFSLWYSDITEGLTQSIDFNKASDNHKVYKVSLLIKSKVLPLLSIIFVCILVFIFPVIDIIVKWFQYLIKCNISVKDYDPIQTAIVVVFVISVYLFCLCLSWFNKGKRIVKRKKL